MQSLDSVTTPLPGYGICRIPNIDLLIAIKRSHLYLFLLFKHFLCTYIIRNCYFDFNNTLPH